MRMVTTMTIATLAAAFSMAAAGAAPFDAMRWQKRLLIVFAGEDAARSSAQDRELAGDGVAERDLVVIHVPASGKVAVPGASAADAEAIRRAYAIEPGASFTVLLVGKDGGVKQRSPEPISARDLFATIDAMPMRENEMRRR